MRKNRLVINRDYITCLRTIAFVFGKIALRLFTIGMFGFSIIMATRQEDHTLRIAVLDEVGGLAKIIADGLTDKLSNGQPAIAVVKELDRPGPGAREELRALDHRGQLDAYLL